MGLIYKQLFKQIIKDKIFLSLLLLLTILTSLSFFFVMCSIDGNIKILNSLQALTINQQLYKSALHSNRILGLMFWLSLVSLSTVVYVMFFYRFFRANRKQIGRIIINQITGILVGIILIFLALHISFQDNTHDILILNMLGHPVKHIRKLLIDIYLPVLWVMFLISLAPSMILARAIQKSLSVSTGDYMPFDINLLVIIIAFGLINAIYYGIRTIFHFRIKK